MLKYLFTLLAVLSVAAGCSAQESGGSAKRTLQEGKDYLLINPPQAASGDKIVVTEVFSYACPHCAHFQPYAEELKSKLPKGAEFDLLPAVFQPAWEPFARAFYTAKALGLVDKTHQALFDAIHRDRQPLRSIDDLANLFYSGYGANPGNFLSTASSFVIEGQLAQGNQLVRDYQVDATPTLIIDGKYRVVASPDRGIGFADMVPIALQLVQQELDERAHARKK